MNMKTMVPLTIIYLNLSLHAALYQVLAQCVAVCLFLVTLYSGGSHTMWHPEAGKDQKTSLKSLNKWAI